MNKHEQIETPVTTYRNGPLTRDLDEIVRYVARTKGLGQRAARRFVGRRLNEETLANYRFARAHNLGGQWFPMGFRRASKRGHVHPVAESAESKLTRILAGSAHADALTP